MSSDFLLGQGDPNRKPIGMVIGGSVTRGLDIRLQSNQDDEEVQVGNLVTVQSRQGRFFGTVTDIELVSADPQFAVTAPDANSIIAEILSGTGTFAIARVTLNLTLSGLEQEHKPARSLPMHFSKVYRASNEDVQTVFGSEDNHHIYIGSPLDMEDSRVCLNLEELVKRSNGVFGKSGTGKSFLTRILLAGIVQRDVATNLIFDMHNEYGWGAQNEAGYEVKGLKQIAGAKIAVATVDEEDTKRRGITPDYVVRISYDEIEPEDIAILAPTLNITELGVQTAFTLMRHFKTNWVTKFLSIEDMQALAEQLHESQSTLDALRRRLIQLQRFGFLVTDNPNNKSAITTIMEYLDGGKNIVLEFGRYGDNLAAYLFVANLITRRIHELYRHRTEEAMAASAPKPKPLVITIEEAHRFLSPQLSDQTIFGTIAREMRKYHVTLLVVDQRPSGIDQEVLSQIETRITCQLDNERDIDAVLSGASDSRGLKTVLSKLESQQQALMFGHALSMPIVIRTRNYDQSLE